MKLEYGDTKITSQGQLSCYWLSSYPSRLEGTLLDWHSTLNHRHRLRSDEKVSLIGATTSEPNVFQGQIQSILLETSTLSSHIVLSWSWKLCPLNIVIPQEFQSITWMYLISHSKIQESGHNIHVIQFKDIGAIAMKSRIQLSDSIHYLGMCSQDYMTWRWSTKFESIGSRKPRRYLRAEASSSSCESEDSSSQYVSRIEVYSFSFFSISREQVQTRWSPYISKWNFRVNLFLLSRVFQLRSSEQEHQERLQLLEMVFFFLKDMTPWLSLTMLRDPMLIHRTWWFLKHGVSSTWVYRFLLYRIHPKFFSSIIRGFCRLL